MDEVEFAPDPGSLLSPAGRNRPGARLARRPSIEGCGEVPRPNRAAAGAGTRASSARSRLPAGGNLRVARGLPGAELPDALFLPQERGRRSLARAREGEGSAADRNRPGYQAE